MDVSLGSDGVCTGTGWLELLLPWLKALFASLNTCCVVHDTGGTDGQLLDCWQAALVLHNAQWAWPIAAFAIAYMCLGRPAYNYGQRKGWWK